MQSLNVQPSPKNYIFQAPKRLPQVGRAVPANDGYNLLMFYTFPSPKGAI